VFFAKKMDQVLVAPRGGGREKGRLEASGAQTTFEHPKLRGPLLLSKGGSLDADGRAEHTGAAFMNCE
jgi:hypothetical protein